MSGPGQLSILLPASRPDQESLMLGNLFPCSQSAVAKYENFSAPRLMRLSVPMFRGSGGGRSVLQSICNFSFEIIKFTLPYLTLPYLPYLNLPTLPYLTLPYPTLPYPTYPTHPTLPYLTYRTLPYLTLPTLPYPTLPYLTLPTLPYPTLPYLTLPYLYLPYLTLYAFSVCASPRQPQWLSVRCPPRER